MPKIPGINHLRAVRALEKGGFRIVRQGKHIVMSDGSHFITIPRHNPVNALTMGGIVKDAGMISAPELTGYRGLQRAALFTRPLVREVLRLNGVRLKAGLKLVRFPRSLAPTLVALPSMSLIPQLH